MQSALRKFQIHPRRPTTDTTRVLGQPIPQDDPRCEITHTTPDYALAYVSAVLFGDPIV